MNPFTEIALLDELEKISTIRPDAQANRDRLKKVVKSSLLIAAGTGAGTGTYMLLERAAKEVLGKWWLQQSAKTQLGILTAASAAVGFGTAALAKALMDEKRKREA